MQTGRQGAPVTSPDLDRIRFVTRHFNELKGLSLAASGLLFLGLGAAYIGRGHFVVVTCLQFALIFGSIALTLYARTYYQKTFGEVLARREELPRQEALTLYGPGAVPQARDANMEFNALMLRRMLLVGGLGIIVYVGLRMVSPTVDVSMRSISEVPQFFTTAQQVMEIFLGALFLSTWIWRGCRLSQGYYLALALLMLGIPALGATQGFILTALWDHGLIRMARFVLPAADDMRMGMLVCGASCLLAGLLDHRQLVRALKPAVEEGSL
jgi:hypothetical protein